jgi:hypothetical protein
VQWHSPVRTCSASLLRMPEMAGVTMAVCEKRLNLPLVVFHAPAAFCMRPRGRMLSSSCLIEVWQSCVQYSVHPEHVQQAHSTHRHQKQRVSKHQSRSRFSTWLSRICRYASWYVTLFMFSCEKVWWPRKYCRPLVPKAISLYSGSFVHREEFHQEMSGLGVIRGVPVPVDGAGQHGVSRMHNNSCTAYRLAQGLVGCTACQDSFKLCIRLLRCAC